MNLGALIATLGVNTTGLDTAAARMKQFEATTKTSMRRVGTSLSAAGQSMQQVGRMATMYLTLPLALIGGAAAKMQADFEKSMSKIIGLVGVAREQVNAWTDDVLNMAVKVGRSPQQLADALYFITSAGIRGAEAMDVLEMSAKASASGLGEV